MDHPIDAFHERSARSDRTRVGHTLILMQRPTYLHVARAKYIARTDPTLSPMIHGGHDMHLQQNYHGVNTNSSSTSSVHRKPGMLPPPEISSYWSKKRTRTAMTNNATDTYGLNRSPILDAFQQSPATRATTRRHTRRSEGCGRRPMLHPVLFFQSRHVYE